MVEEPSFGAAWSNGCVRSVLEKGWQGTVGRVEPGGRTPLGAASAGWFCADISCGFAQQCNSWGLKRKQIWWMPAVCPYHPLGPSLAVLQGLPGALGAVMEAEDTRGSPGAPSPICCAVCRAAVPWSSLGWSVVRSAPRQRPLRLLASAAGDSLKEQFETEREH